MSEVDRLSNSGLYPILPMGDKRSPGGAAGQPRKGDANQRQKPDDDAPPPADDDASSAPPRPPKSLIDEYA